MNARRRQRSAMWTTLLVRICLVPSLVPVMSDTLVTDSSAQVKFFPIYFCIYQTYPEIDDASFKCTLWTSKQQLALKMRMRCGISIVSIYIISIVLVSYKRLYTIIFGISLDLKWEVCVIRCQFYVKHFVFKCCEIDFTQDKYIKLLL